MGSAGAEVEGVARRVDEYPEGRAAAVVGYDRSHDIAVLQLQGASGLTTVTTGDSDEVSVGGSILGIGNAGGVGGTRARPPVRSPRWSRASPLPMSPDRTHSSSPG